MPRPRQISNAQILRTMRACVLERGPAVALDVVAERLGVTSPALLKRFGSRRELLIEALRPDEESPAVRAIEAGPGSKALAAELEVMLTRVWDILSESVPCAVALRESGIPPAEAFRRAKDPLRLVHAIERWLATALDRQLVAANERETTALALLGAVQARVLSSHITQKPLAPRFLRAYLRELSRLFTRALTPVGAIARVPARPRRRRAR